MYRFALAGLVTLFLLLSGCVLGVDTEDPTDTSASRDTATDTDPPNDSTWFDQ